VGIWKTFPLQTQQLPRLIVFEKSLHLFCRTMSTSLASQLIFSLSCFFKLSQQRLYPTPVPLCNHPSTRWVFCKFSSSQTVSLGLSPWSLFTPFTSTPPPPTSCLLRFDVAFVQVEIPFPTYATPSLPFDPPHPQSASKRFLSRSLDISHFLPLFYGSPPSCS